MKLFDQPIEAPSFICTPHNKYNMYVIIIGVEKRDKFFSKKVMRY